ncbi:hypothetical protein BDW74DRAFT_182787 [Aspergillus multicolor]|uniref:uncharacterized protein n=1 Tax=Aspergillus multicolor TaxID=41759 RepID=UPI003CCD6672
MALAPDAGGLRGLLLLPPEIFDNIIARLSYQDLLNLMAACPAAAVGIFDWGAAFRTPALGSNAHAWPGHFDFVSGTHLTNWHDAQHAVLNGRLASNPDSMNQPIGWLIDNGHCQTLAVLAARGRWDPKLYGVDGRSYLERAFRFSSRPLRIADLIISIATNTTDPAFAARPSEINNVTQSTTPAGSILDLLLGPPGPKPHQYELWRRYWNAITGPRINALTAMTVKSHRILVKYANRATAESLLNNAGGAVNLATLTWPNETVWHVAAQNPNLDFADFLHQHTPDNIDHCYVLHNHNIDYIVRLLRFKADPGIIPAVEIYIRDIPSPRDKKLHKLLKAIHAPFTPAKVNNRIPQNSGSGGSLLHYIVVGLDNKLTALARNTNLTPAQKVYQRRKLIKHAEGLIVLVRKGNDREPANPATVDCDDRTALGLAEVHGFHQLYYALKS